MSGKPWPGSNVRSRTCTSIPATILSVTRRPKSHVELKTSLDPAQAAIEDARAVALSGGLPEEVPRRVVPSLCRQAIEAACLESGRRRLLRIGMGLDECEEKWADAVKLLPRIAIALYGDADRAGDVYGTLNNRLGGWAADTARACNEMAHSGPRSGGDRPQGPHQQRRVARQGAGGAVENADRPNTASCRSTCSSLARSMMRVPRADLGSASLGPRWRKARLSPILVAAKQRRWRSALRFAQLPCLPLGNRQFSTGRASSCRSSRETRVRRPAQEPKT